MYIVNGSGSKFYVRKERKRKWLKLKLCRMNRITEKEITHHGEINLGKNGDESVQGIQVSMKMDDFH